jgi:hypothetical protein
MTRNCPAHGFKANELIDIFYNGLTEGTRCYLASLTGNVFRERTIEEATKLLDIIARNYEDWKKEETNEEELFSKKMPGIHKLTDETMKDPNWMKLNFLIIVKLNLKKMLSFLDFFCMEVLRI